jgi:hypothetical protein
VEGQAVGAGVADTANLIVADASRRHLGFFDAVGHWQSQGLSALTRGRQEDVQELEKQV